MTQLGFPRAGNAGLPMICLDKMQDTTRETKTESYKDALPLWRRGLDIMLILITLPGWLLVGGIVALLIQLGSKGRFSFASRGLAIGEGNSLVLNFARCV